MSVTNAGSTPNGHYAELRDIRMYYEDYGSGQPLLMLHGGGQTRRAWAAHVPILAEKFRVLTPDSRGHGLTNNSGADLSYALMADDIAQFSEALGLHQPLICGWSDGANIALEVGMRYAALPGAMICCGLYTRLSEQYCRVLREELVMEAPGVVDHEQLERNNPAVIQEWQADHSSLYGPDYWKTLHKQLSLLFLTPLHYTAADYRRISVPTLILSGDRDPFLPVEEHVETYRLIQGAELAIVPNADHDFPASQMGVFVSTVVSFCQRHSHDNQRILYP